MKDIPVMVKMERGMHEWLKGYAAKKYKTVSQVIRDLVVDRKESEETKGA